MNAKEEEPCQQAFVQRRLPKSYEDAWRDKQARLDAHATIHAARARAFRHLNPTILKSEYIRRRAERFVAESTASDGGSERSLSSTAKNDHSAEDYRDSQSIVGREASIETIPYTSMAQPIASAGSPETFTAPPISQLLEGDSCREADSSVEGDDTTSQPGSVPLHCFEERYWYKPGPFMDEALGCRFVRVHISRNVFQPDKLLLFQGKLLSVNR